MSNPDQAPDRALLYTNCDIAEIRLEGDIEVPYMAQAHPDRFVELFSLPTDAYGQPDAYTGRHRRNESVVPLVSINEQDGGRYRFLRRALETAVMYGGQVVIDSEDQDVIYEHDEGNQTFAEGLFAIGSGHIPEGLGRVASAYVIAQGLEEIDQLRRANPPTGEAR